MTDYWSLRSLHVNYYEVKLVEDGARCIDLELVQGTTFIKINPPHPCAYVQDIYPIR